MITRRSVIGGAVGAAAVRGAAQKRPPNFLFLIADDHAAYVMGADGNRLARTPNLDRFAAEGTRFARNYCNAPVCTASRQSFFTGQMPHSAGVTRLPTPLSEEKPTLAKQLRAAGYTTAVYGKMHFIRQSYPGMHGFDLLMTEDDVDRAWGPLPHRETPAGIRTKPRWRPFKDPARIWLNADDLPYPRFEDQMRGTFIARQAVQYLEEHRDRPFALWCSLQEPHSPFDFPVEARAAYDPAKFRAPVIGAGDPPQIPIVFRDLTEADRRSIIAAYYTSVWFLDRNIGFVLDQLRRLNLERDTLVVYMPDHGYCLGHHGRFEKHCGYDPALRVPLIIRWPGHVRRNVVTDFTESVDLAPTVLDLLGVEPLPVQHGQSLRPYLEGGRVATPRDYVFSEYLDNEEAYIRTRRWKYIYCSGKRARTDGYKTDTPTPGRYQRLYDLAEDPAEFHDVSVKNPDVCHALQARMLDRFRRTHPEAAREPAGLSAGDACDWYVRPRDV